MIKKISALKNVKKYGFSHVLNIWVHGASNYICVDQLALYG